MRMRGVISLPVLAVFFDAGLAAQQSNAPISAGELIKHAKAHNLELAALRQRLPEAKGLVRQAGQRPAPTVEASGTTGRPLGTAGEEQYSASYNFTLETGAKRSRRVEVAELGVALADAEFEERSRQLAYEISVLYTDAAAELRKLESLDRLILLNEQSMRLTEARVKEGDAAPLELHLLAVDSNRARADRAVATGRIEATLLELKQLAGIDAAKPLSLELSPPAPNDIDFNKLQQRALQERPDLKLARIGEQQSGAETRLARAQGIPDVIVSTNYSRQYARFDDQLGLSESGNTVRLTDRDDVITIGVQIPIGTRKRNQGSVDAAAARATAARIRREYLERRVQVEVGAATRRLDAARSAVAIFSSQVLGQSEKNLEVIRQAYQLGQFRLIDVLAEQRRVIETRLSYSDAQTELAKSIAELERAVGGSLQ